MEIIVRLFFWNLALALLTRTTPDPYRRFLRWLVPLGTLLLPQQTPLDRLAAMSLFLLFAFKSSLLLGRSRSYVASLDLRGLALYFSLWPGVDPKPFEQRQQLEFPLRWFVQGWVTMIVSTVAIGALALSGNLNGWWMLAGLLAFVHLGYSDVLSSLMRLLGFPVARLFDQPLASQSLREFWSRRWNRPFADLNRLLFLPSLRGGLWTGFAVSGLLHEAALSHPAQGGWGGPMVYFGLQAIGLQLPQRRLTTWAWLLLPLPLLFPAPFHQQFLEPLAAAITGLPIFQDPMSLLSFLLSCAGWGHFLVLVAGLQVPWRLQWRQELARLRPLNRKLLWVYYGYIGSFILTFGLVILQLHQEMLSGERGATTLLAIITLFWTGRIVIDALVFKHSDWPEGPLFGIGHTLLTSLFVFLAITGWLVLLT